MPELIDTPFDLVFEEPQEPVYWGRHRRRWEDQLDSIRAHPGHSCRLWRNLTVLKARSHVKAVKQRLPETEEWKVRALIQPDRTYSVYAIYLGERTPERIQEARAATELRSMQYKRAKELRQTEQELTDAERKRIISPTSGW